MANGSSITLMGAVAIIGSLALTATGASMGNRILWSWSPAALTSSGR
jgi:hypothetical protein